MTQTPAVVIPPDEAAAVSADGATLPFRYADPATGLAQDGFLVRHGGRLYAWRNQCRHQPMLLDFGDGDLLTADRRFLECRHHGALYEPDTGLCVAGPCLHARLQALEVIETEAGIEVRPPAAAPELE